MNGLSIPVPTRAEQAITLAGTGTFRVYPGALDTLNVEIRAEVGYGSYVATSVLTAESVEALRDALSAWLRDREAS